MTPSRIARAHWIAFPGESKVARNPSPVVLTSRPLNIWSWWRTRSWCSSSSSRQWASPEALRSPGGSDDVGEEHGGEQALGLDTARRAGVLRERVVRSVVRARPGSRRRRAPPLPRRGSFPPRAAPLPGPAGHARRADTRRTKLTLIAIHVEPVTRSGQGERRPAERSSGEGGDDARRHLAGMAAPAMPLAGPETHGAHAPGRINDLHPQQVVDGWMGEAAACNPAHDREPVEVVPDPKGEDLGGERSRRRVGRRIPRRRNGLQRLEQWRRRRVQRLDEHGTRGCEHRPAKGVLDLDLRHREGVDPRWWSGPEGRARAALHGAPPEVV